MDISTASKMGGGGGDVDVEYMRHLETVGEVASLEQRWTNSWATSLQTQCVNVFYPPCLAFTVTPINARDLKPLRIPLHSKRSKRCPECTHILIKPEQKAQSVRYKIKLVAANYLPAITVALPHTQQAQLDIAKRTLSKSTSEPDRGAVAPVQMHAGKTYPFHLALTNPLYDPIQVRLSVQRMHVSNVTPSAEGGPPEKARRPPFAVSLPTSSFPIAAFAEAWEYEDDEDMFGVEDGDGDGFRVGTTGRGGRENDGKGKTKTVGVLEKRANVTVVGGEVVIGKEARGAVKVSDIDVLVVSKSII